MYNNHFEEAPNNHEWFPVEDPRRRTLPPVVTEEPTKAPAKGKMRLL